MDDQIRQPELKKPYEPPVVFRVHADPVKELLMTGTVCGSDPNLCGGFGQPPRCA